MCLLVCRLYPEVYSLFFFFSLKTTALWWGGYLHYHVIVFCTDLESKSVWVGNRASFIGKCMKLKRQGPSIVLSEVCTVCTVCSNVLMWLYDFVKFAKARYFFSPKSLYPQNNFSLSPTKLGLIPDVIRHIYVCCTYIHSFCWLWWYLEH